MDKLDERNSGPLGKNHDIAGLGIQPRKRIDLDEIRSPLAIETNIDTTNIAAVESTLGGERRLDNFTDQSIR